MPDKTPVLHMFCGKIASGKSTLSERLGATPGAVVIAEDEWLGVLFGEQMKTGSDFLLYSTKLRSIMAPHVISLLKAGATVVLDFAANTVEQRKWMIDIVTSSGSEHELHFLDVPDDVCLERLRARNADGKHEFAATEQQFHRFTAHFVPPSEDEGFNIVHH